MIPLKTCLISLIFWVTGCLSHNAYAHYMNLGLLDIRETSGNHFDVNFNYSGSADKPLGASVAAPENCKTLTPTRMKVEGKTQQLFWRMRCDNGLENEAFLFKDLENGVNVLIRVTPLDGKVYETQLPKHESTWSYKPTAEKPLIAGVLSYIPLGVEHILKGIDHVFFVMAIVVLFAKQRKLLRTVTAFTVGHSITLALSSLGAISLPSAPVEVLIALSIVLMAREMLRPSPQPASITQRFPELIAVLFGLLHGLGFAGVLAEIGLPEEAVFSSLLCFNTGIELGQVLIIGLFLPVLTWFGRWSEQRRDHLIAYTMGTLASFWMMERMLLL